MALESLGECCADCAPSPTRLAAARWVARQSAAWKACWVSDSFLFQVDALTLDSAQCQLWQTALCWLCCVTQFIFFRCLLHKVQFYCYLWSIGGYSLFVARYSLQVTRCNFSKLLIHEALLVFFCLTFWFSYFYFALLVTSYYTPLNIRYPISKSFISLIPCWYVKH